MAIDVAPHAPAPEVEEALPARYPVPSEDAFADDDAEESFVDFIEAMDVEQLGNRLIAQESSFSHLKPVHVHFLWKRHGGTAGGKPVFGRAQKPSGLLRHYSDATFVVWLAADRCRDAEMTRRAIEALTFHLLCQCGYDVDRGVFKILAPEVTAFLAELKAYGPWQEALVEMTKATQQLPLIDN